MNENNNMELTEEQKEHVNGMINDLEMLLAGKDIGTNEALDQKNMTYIYC